MRCAVHTNQEAVGVCAVCGAGVCSKCRYVKDGVNYCQACRKASRIPEPQSRLVEPAHNPAKPGRFMDTPSVTFFIIGIVGMILIAVGTALSFVLYSKQYFSVGFTINESSLRLLGLLNILDFGASVLLGIGIVFGGLAFFGLWRSYRSRLALGAAIFSFISAPWPLPPRLLEVLGLSWNVVPSYSGYSLEPGPFYPLSVILSIVKICLVGVAFALWSVTAVANSFRAEHQLIMLTAGVLLAIASVEIISGLTGASYLLLGFPSYYYLIGYTPGQWLFPAVLLFSVALRYAHTGN